MDSEDQKGNTQLGVDLDVFKTPMDVDHGREDAQGAGCDVKGTLHGGKVRAAAVCRSDSHPLTPFLLYPALRRLRAIFALPSATPSSTSTAGTRTPSTSST